VGAVVFNLPPSFVIVTLSTAVWAVAKWIAWERTRVRSPEPF
jgi:hypothetical protein